MTENRRFPDKALAMESAAAAHASSHYVLRLYVTGATSRSARAISNIRKICEEHLEGRYDLEVVDIAEHPTLAEGEQIIAAPTLIKKLPLPLRRFIGDMSQTERILLGLDLRDAADQAAVSKKPPIRLAMKSPSTSALLAEIADLRARLAETEDTLRAIRNGDVDALVVEGSRGPAGLYPARRGSRDEPLPRRNAGAGQRCRRRGRCRRANHLSQRRRRTSVPLRRVQGSWKSTVGDLPTAMAPCRG